MKFMIALSTLLALTAAACGGGAEPAATTPQPTTTTLAPTTTEAGVAVEPAEIVPGADADVDAVVEAFAIVFDSTTSYEEKAPYLVEPEGLEETVAKYAETGEQLGGVSVEATGVSIEGDAAVISYTLLFAGNPTYTGLSGDAVRTDAGWQITWAMFCNLMTSARVGCPPA